MSIPDETFRAAEELANRLGLNRSQLYARALRTLLEVEGEDPVTARLDQIAAKVGDGGGAGRAAARHLIADGAWEW